MIKGKNKVFEKYEKVFGKKKGPLVSIVTTAYNNEKFNKKYFDSVNNQTYDNIEVIFVDNLSFDNTVEDSKKRLKNGKIIASKINTGCAGGNNLGALETKGKYIFLLGPDAWIDKGCIELLVKAAEKSDNIIYAPRKLTYDGNKFLDCGIAADLFGYPVSAYEDDGKKQIRKIFYADGSGVFITRRNYFKIGMMDEETFLYAEDVDLSWKAHLMGMDLMPVYNSIIYHWSGGAVKIGGYYKGNVYETGSNRRFLAERNIIRNILKNYRWWNILWILPFYLLINLFEIIALMISGQFTAILKTYLKAYVWNIKNISSTLDKRRSIQNTRTVGDLMIMKKMYFLPGKFLAFLKIGIPKIKLQ